MGLPLFKTPTMVEPSATENVAALPSGVLDAPVDWPDLESDVSPPYTPRVEQNIPRVRSWSLLQTNAVSSESAVRFQATQNRREASQTQNGWRPLDSRRRTALSGTEYVEGRLRDAVGMEINRLSEGLHAHARNIPEGQDRQAMENAEIMIENVRRDLRRMVDARMGAMIRPTWATDTSPPSLAQARSLGPFVPVPLVLSVDSVPGSRPGTPTTADYARRGSLGVLRPSPASTAQLVPHSETLSPPRSPEPITIPQYVVRAITPPIRSAAPSPPAIVGHVRGRHSPTS
ncbi:hypothetical protein BKA64DRAFT_727743 [Cadophora sp. MPI-SDFR-AT-0126]|nr:hypothetical protein BKA64DRAFT_727743 [Leotiomycetes sp. MPI-SDFR-AT-0126]